MLPSDTSPAAMTRYFELLRAQSPAARLRTAVALTDTVRQLAVAGIRGRHPEADEQEIRVRLTVRIYGRQIVERLFSNVPQDAR